MNDKKVILVTVIIMLCVIIASFGGGYWLAYSVFNSKNQSDNRGIGEYQQRERELLERIGEYQRREEERNRREAERIRAEGERIERTQTAINSIRQFDRRTGDLYQELRAQNNILANYFGDSVDIYNNELIDVEDK